MGPPQLSNVVRMQIIGMREAGMSLRQIAQRVGHHHSTVSHIVNKHRLTNDVKDRPQSVRPCITSRREDNAPGRLVRRNPFANSEKTVVVPSLAICKNNPKSSEIDRKSVV